MQDGHELVAPAEGSPLGLRDDPDYAEDPFEPKGSAGVLLYTDGLTEARRAEEFFALDRVSEVLGALEDPTPSEAMAVLRARVADLAYGTLSDDLCLLAARIDSRDTTAASAWVTWMGARQAAAPLSR